MYGSSLSIVTDRPLLSKRAPNDAEAIPLPNEDTTPPVTNINLVCFFPIKRPLEAVKKITSLRWDYRLTKTCTGNNRIKKLGR